MVPFHELGFFGQPEEDRVHDGRVHRRGADFVGQSTEVGEKRGLPRLGSEFRLFGQADRREYRREVERVLEVYVVPVGRLVVQAARIVLVQVRVFERSAIPEVQDERILDILPRLKAGDSSYYSDWSSR